MIALEDLNKQWPGSIGKLDEVTERFPFRMSGHFHSLIRTPGDAAWRQAVPDPLEIEDESGLEDPLNEERLSPAPNIVHRYPNRVLWLVSDQCAVHCRFCTRKRLWRKPRPLTREGFGAALHYIGSRREVKDVLLSGGDPLMLPDTRLEEMLTALRKIRHVEIIRIGTRIPCALPERVTPELARMLAGFHPLYLNLHFNHPVEIMPKTAEACRRLADAGIPLGGQTVLLRGVNDTSEVLGELFQKLLTIRVRPYYLMQMDLTAGTSHFRTPVARGLEILQRLRNHISGLAMPHFVIDLPGGRGKVPLTPDYVEKIGPGEMILRDYLGELCRYPLLPGEDEELRRGVGRRQ